MLYGTNSSSSRRAKWVKWAPLQAPPVDNPVRRYLKSRRPYETSRFAVFTGNPGRGLRPVF